MKTSHVRLNGGRQDGRVIALDPRAAARLETTGEETVVWRDHQQVWVTNGSTSGEAFVVDDVRSHRDGVEAPSSQPAPSPTENPQRPQTGS